MPDLILRPFKPAFPLHYGFLYPAWQSRSKVVTELANEIGIVAASQVARMTDPNAHTGV
ncbi:hypothetical protein [Bradyrhizobium sp. STM 3562]|uniref:hypothetical protein n=1 Tax=Bradyrhizobium sp. STM 3562 TaxID=578924 RepID=UPI00388E3E7B